jgi:RNA polymerase sigma-B factor
MVTSAPDRTPLVTEAGRSRALRRYARERRADDLERLVVAYRPLAVALARRCTGGMRRDGDLEQAACEGLVKALQRFDPDRGTAFTSFAVPTILGQVRRHVRDTAWPAHVPRPVQEHVAAVRAAADALTARRARAPSAAELAHATGLTEEEVVDALLAGSAMRTVPLEGDGGPAEVPVAERVGAEDPGYARAESAATLVALLPALAAEHQLLLRLRFADDLSQRQIADCMGVSRSQVGRLLASALDQLREAAARGAAGPQHPGTLTTKGGSSR